MAPFSLELLLLILAAAQAQATAHPGGTNGNPGMVRYSRVFVFGDSFTDTGNSDISPLTAGGISSRPPYGRTYFGHPSGRSSDGRIIIDFLEHQKIMESSVFSVGLMGDNDCFFALLSNRTVDQTARLVPHVVGAIRSAVTEAITTAGARTVLVMGMARLGCAPYVLSLFPGLPGDYDPGSGCNKRLNRRAQLHNRALKRMLADLQLAHHGTSLIYADVYHPVASLVASPVKYGFGDTPLVACCGSGGGPYNFNFTAFCGDPASTMIDVPSKYIYWDGIHFTEAASKFIASGMLRGKLKITPGY